MQRVMLFVLLLTLAAMGYAQSAPFRAEFSTGRGEFRIGSHSGRPTAIRVELKEGGRGVIRLMGEMYSNAYFFGRWSGAGSITTFRVEDATIPIQEGASFALVRIEDEVRSMRFTPAPGQPVQNLILVRRSELASSMLYSTAKSVRVTGSGDMTNGDRTYEFADFALQIRSDNTVTMTSPLRAFGYAVAEGSDRNINIILTEVNGEQAVLRGILYVNASGSVVDSTFEGRTSTARPQTIRFRWRLNATGTETPTTQLFVQRGMGKFKMTPNRADLPAMPMENYNKVTVSLGADGVLTLTLDGERGLRREIKGRWMQHEPNVYGFNVTSIRSGTNQDAFGGGTIEVSGTRIVRIRFYGKGDSNQFSLTFDGS
ncbi:MAG: hypothetical protein IT206_00685 [Fimbriimonadaceae bacterium]|nr:hypothetical protein [Fimbriimonadaceae bacterium]